MEEKALSKKRKICQYPKLEGQVLTRPRKRAFLEEYEKIGNVTAAAERIGMRRQTHYDWLESDPQYKLAVKQAERTFIQNYEFMLDERARSGKSDPASAICAMFRLKKLVPAYRDGQQINVNQGVQVSVSTEERRERVKAAIKKVQMLKPGAVIDG